MLLVAPVAARTWKGIASPSDLALLLPALLLGLIAADFSTGLLHWLCDTFFGEHTPIIGSALIEPFREHHRDPLAMTQKGFFRVSRASFFAMSAGLSVIWWRETGLHGDCHSLVTHATWLVYSFAMVLTNQLHMWAHADAVPRVIAALQKRGLVLSPARHARHHSPPYTRAFCITTGWLNPFLDHFEIFTRLERAVAFIARRLPRYATGGAEELVARAFARREDRRGETTLHLRFACSPGPTIAPIERVSVSIADGGSPSSIRGAGSVARSRCAR